MYIEELSDMDKHMLLIYEQMFVCKNCGWCCMHCDPIEITTEDIIRIAKYLNKPIKVIKRKYVKKHPTTENRYALSKTNPCHFYDVVLKKCKIYPVRLSVCTEYPIMTAIEHNYSLDKECEGSVKFRTDMDRLNDMMNTKEGLSIKNMIESNLDLKNELIYFLDKEYKRAKTAYIKKYDTHIPNRIKASITVNNIIGDTK